MRQGKIPEMTQVHLLLLPAHVLNVHFEKDRSKSDNTPVEELMEHVPT